MAGPWFAEVGRGKHGGEVIGIGPEADVVDDIVAEIPFDGEAPSAKDWQHARIIRTAPDGVALAELVIKYFGSAELSPKMDADIALRDAALAIVAKANGTAP